MMGRQKKDGNHFPPNNKLVQDQREMKKTDAQIQTPTNKNKLCQRTHCIPQKQPERRNPANNQ
jgi:hypothetical protein